MLFPLFFSALCACGPHDSSDDNEIQEEYSQTLRTEYIPIKASSGFVDNRIPLKGDNKTLSLADSASRMVVSLGGCRSGYSVERHDSQESGFAIPVYAGDIGCVVSLESFYINGEEFLPESGSGFSGPGSGLFTGSNGSRLEVVQFKNLSFSVLSTDFISFGVSAVKDGGNYQFIESYPAFRFDGVDLIRGGAPGLEFSARPSLVSVVAQGQRYILSFEIKLECPSLVTGTYPHLVCSVDGKSVVLSEIWYRWDGSGTSPLVYGSYSSVHDKIRSNKKNNSGSLLASAVSMSGILPPSDGFNGGVSLTLSSEQAMSNGTHAFSLLMTSTGLRGVNMNEYGNSALVFSVSF